MSPRCVLVAMCAVAPTLGACAASMSSPREYLDEKTAVTITTASKPMVFAHERPDLATHSREYVTLAAAAVNRSGAIEYYLFVYLWSTVDRRGAPESTAAADELTITADDRQIRPQLFGHSPQEAGAGSAVGAPPGHHWSLRVYRSDLATLHFVSEARQVNVVAASPDGPVIYEIWDDGRAALKSLVGRLEGRE